ncbi:MAG: carbon starvation protein A [Nitrospira sp.]|nr:carbon starvation protein A [Nitrospira sp.]
MNALFLLLTGAAVFVLGYRFYAKLLALSVFRLDANYSTSADAQADEPESVTHNRHLVFGYHFALVAGATTLTGAGISVVWGWVPAFLWVVVGTVVAAGVYGLGTLWLARREPASGMAELVANLMGSRARSLVLILATALILTMNAVFAWLTAEMLKAYPSAVLPFWTQMLLALGLGFFLHRAGARLARATLITVVLALIAVWLLGHVPVAFSGALNIDLRGHSLLSLDATPAWVVLLFVSSYYVTRAPHWKLAQPRGYLMAWQAGLLLLIVTAAIIIMQPTIVAPNFNTLPTGPRALPWIFVTLTSGAIAGFYLLFAQGITARHMVRVTDARYLGYGAAVAEGALALSVILVCTAGFSSPDKWAQFYSSWQGVQSLPRVLRLYIDGSAGLAGALGIDKDLARTFAAVVVTGLIAVTLDAGIRVQKQLLTELVKLYGVSRLKNEKTVLLFTVTLAAALALYDGHGRGGLALWPLFGSWNQILALTGLLLIALALRRRRQPAFAVWVPALFLLLVTTWALGSQLALWWHSGDWLLLCGGIILLGLEGWLVWEAWRAFRRPPAAVLGA